MLLSHLSIVLQGNRGKLGLLVLACLLVLLGQQGCKPHHYPELVGTEKNLPLIYEDTLASDKREVKEKKPKKKTFYGKKTRKAFTKTRNGRTLIYELFYTLKVPEEPDSYVQEKFWYNRRTRKLLKYPIPPKDKKYAAVPHGPYKRVVNGRVQKEGIFYVGTMHGRWETYFTNSEEEILAEKEKYLKGWPKDAEMTWYDPERTKVREVLPLVEGKPHGMYYRFYEDGSLAEKGEYAFGKKIKQWFEYFPGPRIRTKKQIQYQREAWEDEEPYTLIEYNDEGELIYDWYEEQKKNKDKK